MKKSFAIILGVAAVLSLAIAACKNSLTGNAPIVFPTSNVSYNKQVQPLFNDECAYPGCHDANAAENGAIVSLTSYASTCNSVPGIVIKGNAKSSLLAQYVSNEYPQHIPVISTILNQNQVQGIITWINEGANNN